MTCSHCIEVFIDFDFATCLKGAIFVYLQCNIFMFSIGQLVLLF